MLVGMWDEGQLERVGRHHLEVRLAAVGVSAFFWRASSGLRPGCGDGCVGRSARVLLSILSHSLFVHSVLSKVSFRAAVQCFPPSSDREHSVDVRCAGHPCFFGPSQTGLAAAPVVLGSA